MRRRFTSRAAHATVRGDGLPAAQARDQGAGALLVGAAQALPLHLPHAGGAGLRRRDAPAPAPVARGKAGGPGPLFRDRAISSSSPSPSSTSPTMARSRSSRCSSRRSASPPWPNGLVRFAYLFFARAQRQGVVLRAGPDAARSRHRLRRRPRRLPRLRAAAQAAGADALRSRSDEEKPFSRQIRAAGVPVLIDDVRAAGPCSARIWRKRAPSSAPPTTTWRTSTSRSTRASSTRASAW